MEDATENVTESLTGSLADHNHLAAELRRLRLAEPSPALRRRALAAAMNAGAVAPRPAFLADWWRELALAGAALLIFSTPLPAFLPALAFPTWPLAPQPTAAQVQAESAALADELGVRGMAAYFEKKALAGGLSRPASDSRSRSANDPS